MRRFVNKVVLVTGGGSGIGETSARRFAAEGAAVIIADWNEADGRQAAERINTQHPAPESGRPCAIAIRTDVSNEEDVARLIRSVIDAYGRLDVLYNNAAVIHPGALEDIEMTAFERLMAVNVKGVFLMIKHAIPHLRRSKGSIVNMSSLGGLTGQASNPIYAASKGAVIAMTKSLALDYAPDGVRVNCICPAGVSTPLLAEWVRQQPDPPKTEQALRDMHPLGRPAEPEEVADAVLFLASNQSSFITGTALPVEGGASLGY
ncbi:SDR family oxidoreductase [Paenibacillus rhizovicinus]|uniref:SDR family oxidoreductase n=1 Tax=Paenibacillus rhizovicinus TaxID=2704463 RepID=A0A6C0P061_9BACL|nr:SDR family oxidoreductase [Paenibacillus rhizovicinus]QHW31858.1 SDR family oxidoreductase [Paenibacillus rhizovicinus]